MKWQYTALIVLFGAGGLIYSANHYHSKYETEKTRADTAVKRAESTEAVMGNVIQAVRIMNFTSEANQNAKNQIALDAQRAQNDIKMAVKGDICANQPVPASAVKRLREFANDIHTCSSSSDTSQHDC